MSVLGFSIFGDLLHFSASCSVKSLWNNCCFEVNDPRWFRRWFSPGSGREVVSVKQVSK